MHHHRNTQPAGCAFQLEAVLKLAAARDVLNAMLGGRWLVETDVVAGVAQLVDAAASDARRAELLAA